MEITTVLIDIDDTLLDFTRCAKWSMTAAAAELGLHLPPNAYEVFARINPTLWRGIERGKMTPEELYRDRWNLIFKELHIAFDGVRFERHFLEKLSYSTVPVDGAVDALQYLHGKYRVFAASNGPYGQQVQRMKLAGMAPYLDGYFISEQIGHAKPDRAFFAYCRRAAHAGSPEEMLMIGDSLTADVAGALAFGMHVCWLDRAQTLQAQSGVPTVHALSELKTIL